MQKDSELLATVRSLLVTTAFVNLFEEDSSGTTRRFSSGNNISDTYPASSHDDDNHDEVSINTSLMIKMISTNQSSNNSKLYTKNVSIVYMMVNVGIHLLLN